MSAEKEFKVRADSVLGNLPEERQEQIEEWATTRKSDTCVGGLNFALEQLAADGIKVAKSTLSEFLSARRLRRRCAFASSRALQTVALLQERGMKFSPEQVEDLGQSLFTVEAMDAGDGKEFREMEYLRLAKTTAKTKAALETRKLALAERRVQLMEKKLERAAQIVKTAQEKGGMTAETLAKLEKELRML